MGVLTNKTYNIKEVTKLFWEFVFVGGDNCDGGGCFGEFWWVVIIVTEE